MQRVEIEFLAGINYNTLLLFYIQYMTIFYMKIPCKALHWLSQQLFFRSARTSWNTFVRPPVRPSVGKKNLDQLYSSINQQRTTANLSDIVWCVSGGVWWCLVVSGGVWWCLDKRITPIFWGRLGFSKIHETP